MKNKVKRYSAGVIAVLLIISFILSAVFMGGCGSEDKRTQSVTATINTCKISNHKDKKKQYYSVSFTYEWEGKKYSGNWHEAPQNYNKGNIITIYIDPNKPSDYLCDKES